MHEGTWGQKLKESLDFGSRVEFSTPTYALVLPRGKKIFWSMKRLINCNLFQLS